MTGSLILNADATLALEPVTYQQFQGAVAGFSPKGDCRLLSNSNLVGTYNNGTAGVGATFTLTATGVLTIDNVAVALNDRILLKGQTSSAQNGMYLCTTAGATGVAAVLTRATDYDSSAEILTGTYTNITDGDTYAGTFWYMSTSGTITVGTTAINFTMNNAIIAGVGLEVSAPNTLAISNTAVTPATYNNASKTLSLTINAQGQITSATLNDIAIAQSQVTGLVSALSGKQAASNNLNLLSSIVNEGLIYLSPVGNLVAAYSLSNVSNFTVPTLSGTFATNNIAVFADTSGSIKDSGKAAGAASGLATLTAGSLLTTSQFPALTGDITNSSGSLATTLTKSSVYQNVITETTTARTLAITDTNGLINCTNVGTTTITIPTNATAAIPIGSIINFQNNGGSSALVNITPAGGVTLNFNTNVSVGNLGLMAIQKVATDSWNVIQLYEEYTHTTNWSGIWASPQAGNSFITRNLSEVSMVVPVVTATQNTSASVSMSTVLPARFRPSVNFEINGFVIADGGQNPAGAGTMNSSGGLTILKALYVNFSGSGTGGFVRNNITWKL
jgi:hypothetical protein